MNYRRIFASFVLFVVLVTGGNNSLLYAQERINQPLLNIQEKYELGFIDAEAATLEQFRLLFKADLKQQAQIHKCATPALIFLHQHKAELSRDALNEIESYTERENRHKTQVQESYISASGKFEIFYETTGADSVSVTDENGNSVPDYIEWVAEAADSSYAHEVLTIGFKDPIPIGFRYEVYVEDITFGAYGYTETTTDFGPETKIYIENDFQDFPPNTDPEGHQKGAIKATMAHEFKHAIQFAQNSWTLPSGGASWSEMDATLMEEVVYDDVNDYYNYIKIGLESSSPNSWSIFGNSTKSTPGAYYFVTWMIYYSEIFGNDLWKDVWQRIEEQNDLGIDEALIELLPQRGTDFPRSFVQNHLWHFASGERQGNDPYGFQEKEFYPTPNVRHSYSGVPMTDLDITGINKLAAHYYEIIPSSDDDGFVETSIDFDSTQVGIGLIFYKKDGTMEELISTGEDKAQVYLPSEITWQEIDRLGVIIANPGLQRRVENLTLAFGKDGKALTIRDPDYAELPDEIVVNQNYPNPFNPITTIKFELPQSAFVELEVFDITGRKVQTLISENKRFGIYEEVFDGSSLASGVYLYRLQIDQDVYIKKMTLIK